MTQKYQPGASASINPSSYQPSGDQQQFSGEFAALVKVVSSRYGKLEYPPESGFTPKIAVVWTLVSTSGKQFEKKYSTGIVWDTVADISADGTRLISKSPDFAGFKPNSDGLYLLRKAISSGFPAELLTDNIGVFDGHCFFITTDVNPAWKGSSKKAYPKEYHPEGFEAALAARAAKKAEQSNPNTTATMTGSYAPPAVVSMGSDVLTAAGTALVEILAGSGGKINRTQIPAKLNEIAPSKNWQQKFRQDVTLALWDINLLGNVVNSVGAKLNGETISLT